MKKSMLIPVSLLVIVLTTMLVSAGQPVWEYQPILQTDEDVAFASTTYPLASYVFEPDLAHRTNLSFELAAPFPANIEGCVLVTTEHGGIRNVWFDCAKPKPNWNGVDYQGVRVIDPDGNSDYTQIIINVAATADLPVAEIVEPAGSITVIKGTTVSFIGRGSDADLGDVITGYFWDLDSSKVGFEIQYGEPEISYTYNNIGQHTIYLVVK
ncbi:MAG: hypothetical protein V1659_00990, partial [Candidatus Woesearchaeota archaeon]